MRTVVDTYFSVVDGGFETSVVLALDADCFETVASTVVVIIPSPETQPSTFMMSPDVISRVVEVYRDVVPSIIMSLYLNVFVFENLTLSPDREFSVVSANMCESPSSISAERFAANCIPNLEMMSKFIPRRLERDTP